MGGIPTSSSRTAPTTSTTASMTTVIPTAPGSCERLIYIDEVVRGDNHTTMQLARRLHASHRGLVDRLRRNANVNDNVNIMPGTDTAVPLSGSRALSSQLSTCDDDPRMARGGFGSPTYRKSHGARFPTDTGFPSTVEDGIQVRTESTSTSRRWPTITVPGYRVLSIPRQPSTSARSPDHKITRSQDHLTIRILCWNLSAVRRRATTLRATTLPSPPHHHPTTAPRPRAGERRAARAYSGPRRGPSTRRENAH